MTTPITNTLPRSQDFEMAEGMDHVLAVTSTDNAGTVLDLTNATAIEWIMQPAVDDAAGKVTKAIGSGVAITSPATAGLISITIDAADSSGVPTAGSFVNWYHRCKVTISSKTYLLFIGTVKIWDVA